jgi:hypothetical protein
VIEVVEEGEGVVERDPMTDWSEVRHLIGHNEIKYLVI